jgi:ATP-dependent exoDNAse (exonuclease V) beta subunit
VSAILTGAVPPGVRAALRGQEPTPEQLAAITAPLGPVHVIAGAGSGKTAVMAARIVFLVERLGVAPASVLGLTFTNKAASELETRVREALADTPVDAGDEVTVDTYHAFAAGLVKAYGIRVGVEVDADLLSEAQQYQILLGILDSERFEHLSVRTAGATIRKTLELASACADHVVPAERVVEASRRLLQRADEGERLPDWMLQAARERIELARLVERYAAEKRRRGRLDFGDQVAKAVELVEGHPELLEELRTRFQHVLLDEYQDTNVAQRRLMQRICPPGASIMAVGDARQAIYAFRGATMYNLLSFADHFPATPEGATAPPIPATPDQSAGVPPLTLVPDPPATAGPAGAAPPAQERPPAPAGDPLPLSTNFRSGPRILALANSIIDRIPEERRGGTSLVARPGAAAGRPCSPTSSPRPPSSPTRSSAPTRPASPTAPGRPGATSPSWSGPSGCSARSARPSSSAGSRSRSSACPACWRPPRSWTSSRPCAWSPTPAPTSPWPASCSGPAGGSATGTWSGWPAGPPGTTGASRTSFRARTPTPAT